MSFFLGMSVISLMEFCCYGATRAKSIYLERSKNMKVEDNNNVNEDNQDKQERKATPPVDTGGAGASKPQFLSLFLSFSTYIYF